MNKLIIYPLLYFGIISTCNCQVLIADSLDIINPNKVIKGFVKEQLVGHTENDSLQDVYFHLLENPPKDSSTYYNLQHQSCIDSVYYTVETKKGIFRKVGWKTRSIIGDSIWECNVGLNLRFYKDGSLLEYNYKPEDTKDSIEVMFFGKKGEITQYRKMPNFSCCEANKKGQNQKLYYQEFYKKGVLKSVGFMKSGLRKGKWRFYKKGELVKEKDYN